MRLKLSVFLCKRLGSGNRQCTNIPNLLRGSSSRTKQKAAACQEQVIGITAFITAVAVRTTHNNNDNNIIFKTQ